MPKQKYTPGQERRRFKERGQGLRARESRIQEQAQIGIDAMKLAALRQEKLDNQFISGLTSKHNFEEGVLREKQELEGKARTRKYEAFRKFAETDVARMEGKAKDLEKKAEFWKDFAPKFAENLSKLAVGAWGFQDKLKGMARLNEMYDNGLLKNITDGTGDASYGVGTNINLDRSKLRKEGNHDQSNLLGKIFNGNSHWLSLKMAKFVKENRELIRDDIIASFGEEFYTENNAVELQRFGMHQIMEQMGVSPRSAGGVQMLEQATNIGLLDRRNIIGKKNASLTEGLLDRGKENLGIALQAYFTDKNDPSKAKRVRDNLSLMINTQMENHLSGTFIENGKLITPATSRRNKQEIYSTIIQNIIKNNYKWMTREQVEELLAMAVPKLEGEKKSEPYDKKFPTLAKTQLDEYDKLKREQHNQADDAQKQTSIARMNEVNASWDDQYFSKGIVPTKEEQLKGVNDVMNDSRLLLEQKKQILHKRGFNAENHDILPYVLNIKNNFIDGNLDEVERLLRSKNIKQHLPRILKEYEVLRELQEYGPIENSTSEGLLGFYEIIDGRYKALEEIYPGTNVGKGLTPSGAFSKSEHRAFAMQVYTKARKTMSVADAVQHTLDKLDEEWTKGQDGTNNAKAGTGIFARKLVKGQWVFPRYQDLDQKAYDVWNSPVKDEEYTGDGKWTTLAEVTIGKRSDVKSALEHMLIADSDVDLGDAYTDVRQVLTSERVTNKFEMTNFIRHRKNYDLHGGQGGKKVDGKFIDERDLDVPQGFHIISKFYGIPLHEAVNTWVEARKDDPKWKDTLKDFKLLAGEDAFTKLVNSDVYVSKRNFGAVQYINNIKNESGRLPTKQEVRAALDGIEAGADREQIVTKLFNDKTKINWRENEDGTWTFSDSNGFLANGGLDLPLGLTPEQFLKKVGYDPENLILNYDQRLERLRKRNEFWGTL